MEAVLDQTHELQRRIREVEQEQEALSSNHSSTENDQTASRERDALLVQLQRLWEETGTPAEDVAAFLSDLDLMAPFNEAVLQFYEQHSTALL